MFSLLSSILIFLLLLEAIKTKKKIILEIPESTKFPVLKKSYRSSTLFKLMSQKSRKRAQYGKSELKSPHRDHPPALELITNVFFPFYRAISGTQPIFDTRLDHNFLNSANFFSSNNFHFFDRFTFHLFTKSHLLKFQSWGHF